MKRRGEKNGVAVMGARGVAAATFEVFRRAVGALVDPARPGGAERRVGTVSEKYIAECSTTRYNVGIYSMLELATLPYPDGGRFPVGRGKRTWVS